MGSAGLPLPCSGEAAAPMGPSLHHPHSTQTLPWGWRAPGSTTNGTHCWSPAEAARMMIPGQRRVSCAHWLVWAQAGVGTTSDSPQISLLQERQLSLPSAMGQGGASASKAPAHPGGSRVAAEPLSLCAGSHPRGVSMPGKQTHLPVRGC